MRVDLDERARAQLRRLDAGRRRQVQAALARLEAHDLEVGNLKPLVGSAGYFRLRVGDQRVLFCRNGRTWAVRAIEARRDLEATVRRL